MEKIKITFMASCGIMVAYKKIKIMIDGLQSTKTRGLSGLPGELIEELLRGEGCFSHCDYLLFTHEHEDHFSVELLEKYIKSNQSKKCFFPILVKEGEEIKKMLLKNSLEDHLFSKDEEVVEITPEIKVKAFKTPHLAGASDPLHYCYLLKIENRTLLFTGDAKYQRDIFEKEINDENIDIVFVNPLFINKKEGREIIDEIIKPELMCVYHMPFPEDDYYRFDKLVQRDLSKYGALLPRTKIFRHTYDFIEV